MEKIIFIINKNDLFLKIKIVNKKKLFTKSINFNNVLEIFNKLY